MKPTFRLAENLLVAPLPQALINVRTIGVFCLIRVYFDQTHPPNPQKFVAKKSRSEEGIWRFLDRPRQRHVWIGPDSTERHFRIKFSLIQWRVYQGQKDRPRASLAQPHSIWPAWSGSGVVTKTSPSGMAFLRRSGWSIERISPFITLRRERWVSSASGTIGASVQNSRLPSMVSTG